MTRPLQTYLQNLEREHARGVATEHTYRPALKQLLEALDPGVRAVNEPKRDACGAPDYLVSRRDLPLGYIEAKDIGVDLDSVARGAQLNRYFAALENLILTDYLEFRWYVNGELRLAARPAKFLGGTLVSSPDGLEETEALLRAFLAHAPQTIRRPADLATRMANLAHLIRDIIVASFEQNTASDMLKDWRSAFAQTLMHDLERPEKLGDFADMFTQTLAYGLFSARVMDKRPETFSRPEAQTLIPKSNPFLRQFFYQITGPDLDHELFAPFVDDLVHVLGHTDMEKVLKDFGASRKSRDPVFHFYETFLAAYDPTLRERRGVYYTPDPAVSYIVRSVDHVLKSKFKCPEGLADASKVSVANTNAEKTRKDGRMRKTEDCHRVLVLDPACGTGTFLYEIIARIRADFMARNDAGMWPGYVKHSLLPRLFGFELMMAPYAIAHFKLSLQLAARDLPPETAEPWRYEMDGTDRLRVFLTNTLEDMHEHSGLPLFARWIADETEAANEVKRDLPIMVIVGNPPYSGHSENNGAWISDLINDYKYVDGKPLGERNSKWLQDDYVKFIRFAQWRLDQSGSGVLAFISNNGYLDNPTFRGMRHSLLQSFNDIYILNLHGGSRFTNQSDSSPDENVFDIMTGVCIALFVKLPGTRRKCALHYSEIKGTREQKYGYLDTSDLAKTKWQKLDPVSPAYYFIPQNEGLRDEYNEGVPLTDFFKIQSMGVATARDALTVAWTREELADRIHTFANMPAETARKHFELGKDAKDWTIECAQEDLKKYECSPEYIQSYAYRPFDNRFTFFTGNSKGFHCRPRGNLMRNMLEPENMALCFIRRSRENVLSNYFVARGVVDKTILSSADNANVAPLYLFEEAGSLDLGPQKTANLNPEILETLSAALGHRFEDGGPGDMTETFGPEDVFHYIYAVLHSPGYRARYADFLKMDFPRIPLPTGRALFAELARLGRELCELHLLESPLLGQTPVSYPVAGDNQVGKTFPKHENDRVYLNPTQYFAPVPEAVWTFSVGGYTPAEKWLKDRRERVLTHADLQHYKHLLAAQRETLRVMGEIDKLLSFV